jgi:Holliday junction resolvasome RuvABC endonuclease subunit
MTPNTTILGLDLGAKMGWALRCRDGKIEHGTEVFTPHAAWVPGQKWLRYRAFLSQMITDNNVNQIVYEDVKNHVGVLAAHAYGGYLAVLQMVAGQHNVELVPVGVGTIKKCWTGNGAAKKPEMIAEARKRGFLPGTDNAADALAILYWAVCQESGHKVPVVKKVAKAKVKAQTKVVDPQSALFDGVAA